MKNLILSLAKNIPRNVKFFGVRTFASDSNKLTSLDVNNKTGVAVFTLNRPPVNALNLDLLSEITNVITELENDRCKGLIITSSSNKVFCAGLDILEMYKSDTERMKIFWRALQDCWLKLYSVEFPTAVAINGHAPAGGCFLAVSTEYRVMLPNFTIGLNETRVGISAPNWLMASFKNVLPTRIAESALISGTLFTTDEALKIGLIDEIANDKADAIAKCEKFIGKFSKISPVARGLTKLSFRSNDLQDFENSREKEIREYVSFLNQPATQKEMGAYLKSLKNKDK